jgi:hypothetical protein
MKDFNIACISTEFAASMFRIAEKRRMVYYVG